MKWILAAVLAWSGAALAQVADPATGTWKLNPARSKLGTAPVPKSWTVTIEATADGEKVDSEMVSADGNTVTSHFEAKFDGKNYPLEGSPNADTVALKRTNASTIKRIDKKDSKIVREVTRVMAKDGRSFTATVKTKDAKGKPITLMAVYEKQ
jgi:hypothetical protein